MTTESLVVLGLGLGTSVAANLLNYYLAHNPKLAANEIFQYIGRVMKGLSQAASVTPHGIEQNIIADLIHVAEHTAEQSIATAGKATAQSAGESRKESAPDKSETPSDPGTPNFGAGGI